jgi:hypothetical protein
MSTTKLLDIFGPPPLGAKIHAESVTTNIPYSSKRDKNLKENN